MNYEGLKKGYEKDITNTENQIAANTSELQTKKNEYTTNYNQQLSNYDNLIQQQNELVDAATKKATDTANAQYEYNSNIINQNKEQAAKDTESNIKSSYIDYMRETNRYGANRENLASNGMTAQGYTESLMASMYNTYQTRVSSAKDSLMKANQEYDNQMQQALLNRDTALAEAAYNDLEQKTKIALSGFEYKTNLYNQYTNYMNDLDNTYFARNQALQSNITNYRNAITGINQAITAEKEADRQYALEQQKLAEEQRQFNESINQSLNFKDGNNEISTPYYRGTLNSDASKYGTFNTKDSNGVAYQPKGISGHGYLTNTGYKWNMDTTVKYGNEAGKKKTVKQNVWKAEDGTLWYWEGRENRYIQINSKDYNW